MNRQLLTYLAASAITGSALLLAQDAPPRPPQPPLAPDAAKPEPRREDARRDSAQRDANAERPAPPPGREGGPGGPGFGGPPPGGQDGVPPGRPGVPPPGGPGGGFGPRGGGPRDFQRRPPGEGRGERPEGDRPFGPSDRSPEGPDGPPPLAGGRGFGAKERPQKPTPYIGVVTSQVSPALGAQLSLKEGFGLVVDDVLAESPAQAAGLQKYDVLKLLNDQQLVDPNHLSGLLRGLGKDTEVTITFVRKGQEQKATLKVGEKMMAERRPGSDLQRRFEGFGLRGPRREQGDDPRAFGQGGGGDPEQMQRFQERMQHFRQDMDRYREQLRNWQKDRTTPMPEPPPAPDLGAVPGGGPTGPADLLREARPGGAARLRLPQSDGVSTFETNRARMVMKDNDGEVEIAMHEGQRTLTAKDGAGKVVFTGQIDTPEQRAAVPQPFLAKLDALEAQQRNLAEGRGPRFRSRDEAPFPPPPPPIPDEPDVQ